MPHKRTILSFLLMILLLLIGISVSLAHEGREVGDYVLTFGWRNEPALVGFPNGPELLIRLHSEEGDHGHSDGDEHDDPMAEIAVALEVEVTFGPESRTLEMRPMFGEIGHYIADVIPTRPGDYSFRVFGTIGDLEIDEVFTSADGSFSSVEPSGDVTFPDELPSVIELLQRIADLEARIAQLEAGE